MITPNRRTLLGAGLVGGAGLLGGCATRGEPAPADATTEPAPSAAVSETRSAAGLAGPDDYTVPDFDPHDWASVRAQFPLATDRAQFAAFVLSPHTAQVSAAVAHHRDRLELDTDAALHDGSLLEEATRRAAASYVGGTVDQVALTDSTTMGIAVMYGGLDLQPGDEILTTTHDFFSTEDTLRLVALRTGARVRRVTVYDDPATATVDELTSRLVDAIGPATRVVAVTWVHSSTGVRLPVAEYGAAIADLNRRRDPADRVLLCVDGVHGFGAVDVDLPDLGCDFLATGTHKWLFGPRGTGIVWARDWDPLTELIPTLLRAAGRGAALARRLPRLRAPMGAGRGVRVPRADRPRPGGGAHHRSGERAEGGPRRDRPDHGGHSGGPGGLGRHRLRRRGRDAPRQRRDRAARGRDRRQRDAVPAVLPATGPEHRHLARGGGPGGRRRGGAG